MSNGDARGRPMTLQAISDTELLAVVDDLSDENGHTTVANVRFQLGDTDMALRSGAGSRLSWMVRYGWLEKTPKGYRLTAMGQAILDKPDLAVSLQNALNRLNPAQRVRLTRDLAGTANLGSREIRDAVRRQFTRTMGLRR